MNQTKGIKTCNMHTVIKSAFQLGEKLWKYTGFDSVVIRRTVLRMFHFCGLPLKFLVTVFFLTVLFLPRRLSTVLCGPSLPTFRILPYVFWQTSWLKWSLAPEQIVQQPRTYLGGLRRWRSWACRFPEKSVLPITPAYVSLCLLRILLP